MTGAKKTRVALIAIVVAAVAGLWFWRSVLRVHGYITGLSPVDATHAIVTVRVPEEYGYGPRAWIALVDADGRYVWSERLPGLPVLGQHDGLLVEDGVAYVRTLDEDRTTGQTSAYRSGDGALVWSTPFSKGEPGMWIDILGNGASVVQGVDLPRGTQLASLAKADGKRQWEQTFDSVLFGVQRMGDTLVFGDYFGSNRVKPVPGFALRTRGCVEHGEIFTLEGPRLLARRVDNGAERTILESLPMPDKTKLGATWACGTRGSRFVFTVTLNVLTELARTGLGIIDVEKNGADPRVTLLPEETGGFAISGPDTAVTIPYPEADPLGGELPRFVPLVPFGEKNGMYVSVLDLDERRLVRRGPEVAGMTLAVFRQGDGSLITQWQPNRIVLARFDGASGKITKAVAMSTDAHWKPFRARDGRLWLFDDAWRSKLPFVVLDEVSLAKVGGTTSTTDALDEAKHWLPD